jgi:leucyl aminopeptidase
MQIQVNKAAADQADADVLVSLAFEEQAAAHPLNGGTGGWIADVYGQGEFSGKPFELVMLHRPAGLKTKRLALFGAGKTDKLNATEMRKLVGAAVRALKGKAIRKIALALEAGQATPEYVTAAAEGAILGDFEPDHLKTDPKKAEKHIDSFVVVVPSGAADLEDAAKRGQVIAEAQNFTREVVNEPANLLTPLVLAKRAQEMAAEFGLEYEMLDRDRMTQLGMGSLLGVSQGSAAPPALIILRYKPAAGKGTDHLALIGKGVTFDTGGVSIKPSDGMEKMKYDMAGGAAVIGAMRAIAQLKPSVEITALIPAVENMVSSRAQRPGDIVTALSGKTIEVLNTDAEGRLILVDAITYAIRLGCTHLIDAATLTGAIAVALGHIHVGAFTNNDEFLGRVMTASKAEGERMWHMPLDDDYKDYLKSAFADLPNIGGRWGGACTAAMFLKEFTEDKPWVHLDIAGTAWLDDAKPFLAKGPSGVPLRTFVRLAMDW